MSCGKPFGTKSTIERINAKLESKHWMYEDASERLNMLKMCDDCRVTTVTNQGFDPYGMSKRANVRTTENYLRERKSEKPKA